MMSDMPALPSVANVLKVQLLWSDSADVAVTSTLYFQYSGAAPSAGDLNNFCAVVCNAFGAEDSLWHTSVDLTGATAVDLTSHSAAEGAATANFAGTSTGGPLAGGTAVVVNYKIARRYRGGKPRNYYPFGDSSKINTRQSWSAAFVAAVASGVSTAIASIIGTSVGPASISNHVNVSYYSGSRVVTSPTTGRARNVPILRDAPLVDNIVSSSVQIVPGSQRRRNRT